MDKKKFSLKENKIFITLLISLAIFILLGYTVSQAYINKITFENQILEIARKNEENIFSINNITLFSSANSESEVKPNSTLNISNLYQYTDIAIFITPVKSDLTYENTLKEVYIDNLNFVTSPENGTPNLYYKNINNFTKSQNLEENKVENKFSFNITSEDEANLDIPTLYNNCANPITLSYINSNIKSNYTLPDAFSQIAYDGSLLKTCNVILSSISCSVSFDIHITNNLGQQFMCPIYIEIPLDAKDGASIYDGKVLINKATNYNFYRYN